MTRALNRLLRGTTAALNRLGTGVPVLDEWPGARDVARGIYWRFLRRYQERGAHRLALLHRRRLGSVVFVGVTGSSGKTTAKDLIAAILSTQGAAHKSPHSANEPSDVVRTVLATHRTDAFSVIEVGAPHPGSLDLPLRLVRPQVGVVTCIAADHYSAYRGLDAIAAEKGKLVRALGPGGVALLNADDPRVLAMAISDYWGNAAMKYVEVARSCREVADYTFFVGPWASRCLRARRTPGDDALGAFSTVRQASQHLRGFLRPGDLVLLKGSNRADHLVRILPHGSITLPPMRCPIKSRAVHR